MILISAMAIYMIAACAFYGYMLRTAGPVADDIVL